MKFDNSDPAKPKSLTVEERKGLLIFLVLVSGFVIMYSLSQSFWWTLIIAVASILLFVALVGLAAINEKSETDLD